MNLSVLHAQVRQMARGAATGADVPEKLSDAERLALHSLQGCLVAVDNDLERVVPVAGYSVWIAPSLRAR